MLSLDIGAGSHPRGDVNVDLHPFKYKDTRHLDQYLNIRIPRVQDYVQADAHVLPFRSERFDIVYCIHTLEHCLQPYVVLCEVMRVLRRGGRALIVVPNAYRNPADMYDQEHIYSWSPFSLPRLVEMAGLRVEKVVLIAGALDILVVARKI